MLYKNKKQQIYEQKKNSVVCPLYIFILYGMCFSTITCMYLSQSLAAIIHTPTATSTLSVILSSIVSPPTTVT